MTTRQLTAYGRRVLRKLDMPEWVARADFRVVRGLKDGDGNPCVGMSDWHPEERIAWVSVDAAGDARFKQVTAIHEILHILYEGHLPPTKRHPYDSDYELGINRTAEALWKAWHSPTS